MKLFSNFKNYFPFTISKKSGNPRKPFDLLGYYNLNSIGWHEVKANLAWHYWAKVQGIKRSVNLISQEGATIKPVIKNKKTGEVYKNFDSNIPVTKFLELLEEPNEDKTYNEFCTSNIASYLVIGESYIITGGVKEPIKMLWQNPDEITVVSNGSFMPYQIIVNRSEQSIIFTLNNEDKRYYNQDGSLQIYQYLDFNPFYKFGNQRGFSRLSSIFYAIEEYIEGNIGNINLLKKGARPAGVITLDDVSTTDQIKEMKDQVKKFYSGSVNDGNLMVLNQGRKFTPINISNKDMQFKELNKIAKQEIYEIFEIPAPFFDNSASSFNNKITARVDLYIFAVLPVIRRYFEELTKMLLYDPKYKDFEITFIMRDIMALESMFDEALLRKSKTGVYTYNELRNIASLEDIGIEGDVIYQPLNLMPVGQPVESKNIKVDMLKKTLDQLNKESE